jgi:hypothetical protein
MPRLRVLSVSVAVLGLTMTPSASAHTDQPADRGGCPEPHVEWAYDAETFTVWATLPASGCGSREQRQFPLWVSITRYEETSVHGVGRDVVCGPFPSSSQSPGRRYACDADLSIDHPEVERASYEVQIGYPGSDGQETAYVDVDCVSDEAGGGCVLEEDPQ